jgi:hypothetical protein
MISRALGSGFFSAQEWSQGASKHMQERGINAALLHPLASFRLSQAQPHSASVSSILGSVYEDQSSTPAPQIMAP